MSLPLSEGHYYHIYNRANGSEKIFRQKDNYRFFLDKYKQYVSPIAETYAYCLMPNHFHFLIRIKGEKEIREILARRQNVPSLKDLGRFSAPHDPLRFSEESEHLSSAEIASKFNKSLSIDGKPLEYILSKQLSNFFNSYTKAFNKQQNRMGSLFMKNFKRKRIEDMIYMKNLVRYIHNNPVEAGMAKSADKYPYSSINQIIENDNAFICSEEVLAWYYNKLNFMASHMVTDKSFIVQ